MERITTRAQLTSLAKKLHITNDWQTTRASICMTARGVVSNDTGKWGRKAEGDAAVGVISPDAVEQYVIVKIGTDGVPVAEVSLASLLAWASAPDQALVSEIAELTSELRAAKAVINECDRRLAVGDADDPVLAWPVYMAYEADASWADEYALRCMAYVADGSKILPGGKPQARSCRFVLHGDSIVEILGNLRTHIAAVDHITSE
jgi:hypothetical protein